MSRLPKLRAKLGVFARQIRENVFGRPYVIGNGAKRTGAHDDGVSDGPEEAHHKPIMPIGTADRPATSLPRDAQRDDTVERRDKVCHHMRPTACKGNGKPSVCACQSRRKGYF